MHNLLFLIPLIVLALTFDYINGFHDSANAIATVISTRALPPGLALIMAAFFNFIGAFISIEVAKTVGEGIVDPYSITQFVVLAGLIGGITWNLITWYYGLPCSSSHSLIGGLAGAVIADQGVKAINWNKVIGKVVLPSLFSPILGFCMAFIVMIVFMWIFRKAAPFKINTYFKYFQIFSAALMALSHGTNDAQKTMGIITLALITAGVLHTFSVPLWVKIACALAMGFGTYAGGWRIIKTMGVKVAKLLPVHGFVAESTSAFILFANAHLGMPISTTHVITSAIFGVGASQRFSAVRWNIATNILAAWLFTLPAAAVVSAIMYIIFHIFIIK